MMRAPQSATQPAPLTRRTTGRPFPPSSPAGPNRRRRSPSHANMQTERPSASSRSISATLRTPRPLTPGRRAARACRGSLTSRRRRLPATRHPGYLSQPVGARRSGDTRPAADRGPAPPRPHRKRHRRGGGARRACTRCARHRHRARWNGRGRRRHRLGRGDSRRKPYRLHARRRTCERGASPAAAPRCATPDAAPYGLLDAYGPARPSRRATPARHHDRARAARSRRPWWSAASTARSRAAWGASSMRSPPYSASARERPTRASPPSSSRLPRRAGPHATASLQQRRWHPKRPRAASARSATAQRRPRTGHFCPADHRLLKSACRAARRHRAWRRPGHARSHGPRCRCAHHSACCRDHRPARRALARRALGRLLHEPPATHAHQAQPRGERSHRPRPARDPRQRPAASPTARPPSPEPSSPGNAGLPASARPCTRLLKRYRRRYHPSQSNRGTKAACRSVRCASKKEELCASPFPARFSRCAMMRRRPST